MQSKLTFLRSGHNSACLSILPKVPVFIDLLINEVRCGARSSPTLFGSEFGRRSSSHHLVSDLLSDLITSFIVTGVKLLRNKLVK